MRTEEQDVEQFKSTLTTYKVLLRTYTLTFINMYDTGVL
jgi:hypothetical protein